MKKLILISTVVFMLIVFMSIATANNNSIFEPCNFNIKLGYYDANLKNPEYLNDGMIYVSLRSICDLLGIPINWNNETKEAIIDVYNKKVDVSDKTSFKKEGVIPDKETAMTIGKVILEKYAGKSLEFETEDKIYFIDAMYLDERNEWRVFQTFKFKSPGGWSVGGKFYYPTVRLNKNTGEVIYINTYSMFAD